ncbi:MAG: hypothetical protein CL685_01650 [Candidatus Magasanikbacteria bacterium]|nr:hypothetical protein [Candidatus Magasanikbacteria bacterium]
MQQYNFQYCQKLVIYSKDESSVLLCKRKDEADFDGAFSFIGGKMENTDSGIIDGLQREKDEEVGKDFNIKVFPFFTTNIFFVKKDGSAMILPHFYAIHTAGDVVLNEEYSEYAWVSLEDVDNFEPKINTISDVLHKMTILKKVIKETPFKIL